jgi:hypothetical protein
MNTEYFYINNKSIVDFNNLILFKFDDKRTKIHVDRINSEYVGNDFLIDFYRIYLFRFIVNI